MVFALVFESTLVEVGLGAVELAEVVELAIPLDAAGVLAALTWILASQLFLNRVNSFRL